MTIYKNQAEQMAKSFIDVMLEALVEEMRASISAELLMTRMDAMQPAIVAKIDGLKSGFWKTFGNHLLGGVASAIVALTLFGIFSLYGKFQAEGGMEGALSNNLARSVESGQPVNQPKASSGAQ